jgi:cytochrome c oxidase assembly protein subunit 17
MSTAAAPTPAPAPPPLAADAPKPKKICCACPDTRKPRDECVVMNGEDKCAAQIEAHKKCLRAEGFDVRTPPCHASHAPCCRLTVPPLARQV